MNFASWRDDDILSVVKLTQSSTAVVRTKRKKDFSVNKDYEYMHRNGQLDEGRTVY